MNLLKGDCPPKVRDWARRSKWDANKRPFQSSGLFCVDSWYLISRSSLQFQVEAIQNVERFKGANSYARHLKTLFLRLKETLGFRAKQANKVKVISHSPKLLARPHFNLVAKEPELTAAGISSKYESYFQTLLNSYGSSLGLWLHAGTVHAKIVYIHRINQETKTRPWTDIPLFLSGWLLYLQGC